MAYLLILTREQAIEGERMEQPIGACLYHTSYFLTLCFSFHSPFFSFLISMLPLFFLIFLLLFFLTLSYLFLYVISYACPFPLLTVHSQGPFTMPAMMGFTVLPLNYFCPGMGVLPRPPTGLSATQPSPLPYVSHATFHSQTKECCFVFLLSVAFPSG